MIAMLAEPRLHTFAREEYDAMWRANALGGKRVELVEGHALDLRPTYDQTVNASLYAKSGIPEYWILNLVKNCLEAYRTSDFARASECLPLASPEASVDVSELLP